MSYLYKQKLSFEDLQGWQSEQWRVVVFEPERYLLGIYSHHLEQNGFEIQTVSEPDDIIITVSQFSPHLLVFNADKTSKDNSLSLFRIKREFPRLYILTTACDLSYEDVKELMAKGISGHINRRLSRPQDIAHIAVSLLKH